MREEVVCEKEDSEMILKRNKRKALTPHPIMRNQDFIVRDQGLEPWTP